MPPSAATSVRPPKPRILLALTRIDWMGTARVPRMLARAGFDVAVLAPPGSLAGESSYVSTIAFVSPRATPMTWIASLAQAIDETDPRVVVPGDETALRIMFRLVLEPPRALPPARRERLATLLAASLGRPDDYMTAIDKTLLSERAPAIGVPMPRSFVVDNLQAAVAAAGEIGGRVVLKRQAGSGGEGVAFADRPDEVREHARAMLEPEGLDLGEFERPRLLVQAFVEGPQHSAAMVALDGRPLAGFAWERFVLTGPVKGQTSLLRFIDAPQVLESTARVIEALGITGFVNTQYIVDSVSGTPLLMDVNRRISSHMHLGERVGCDLGEALFAALGGRAVQPPAPRIGSDDIVAVFPREWLRDPASPNLERYPVDVPWDEPRLMAAMAATWRNA